VPHGSPANLSTRSRRNLFRTFNRHSDGDQRERYYREKWVSYPPNVGAAGHLVHGRHLAHVIEADGRVMQIQRPRPRIPG